MDKSLFAKVDQLPVNERIELMDYIRQSKVSLSDLPMFQNRGTAPGVPSVTPPKKRGRPRKNPIEAQTQAAPRKRGRPRKDTTQASAPHLNVEEKRSYEMKAYSPEAVHIKPGDKIRVPAGTVVRYPDAPERGDHAARRSRTVDVKEIYLGENPSDKGPGRAPTVVWVGSGNYRRAASINDVLRVA